MPGDPLVGATLGAYRLIDSIGTGATGVVYRATHRESARPVALKVLHEKLGAIGDLERRFAREARVLARMSHPNIVEVIDFGVEDGRTFIAMELLEGETLEEVLERGPLDPALALAYYEPILEAIATAHDHDVVHRDLKPANVFLTKTGELKLLDFGLAKMLSAEALDEEGTLTRRGRIVGTPAYMAPEQITGLVIDVRADVYALGVMLYELLADRRPFLHEGRRELLRAHLLEPVSKLTDARPGLSLRPELEALVAKALEKNPIHRYPDAHAMLAALRALPPGSVQVDPSARGGTRSRTGSCSAVISEREREALARTLTESSALPEHVAPPAARGISTSALLTISLALFALTAALWLTLLR